MITRIKFLYVVSQNDERSRNRVIEVSELVVTSRERDQWARGESHLRDKRAEQAKALIKSNYVQSSNKRYVPC